MARDYGSKRTTRSRTNAPQQVLVVIVSFLLGYLTACILDVGTISHWLNSQVLAHNEAKPQPTKVAEPPQQAKIPPKPKFEFYTLLANEKRAPQPATSAPVTAVAASHPVATPVAPVRAATSTAGTSVASVAHPSLAVKSATQSPVGVKVAEGKPLSTTTSQASKGAYLVQVASFKAQSDAEHMKALLTLKGFSVSVVPISSPTQGNWFRVIIGPYANRDLAQKAQVTLAKTERLNGMVRSVGG